MTRFAEHKLIQPLGGQGNAYVILDELSGQEIEMSREEMFRLINAFHQMNYSPAELALATERAEQAERMV